MLRRATPSPSRDGTEITVRWQPASTGGFATRWDVSSASKSGGSYRGAFHNSSSRSVTFTGLDPSKTYDFRVRGDRVAGGVRNGDSAQALNVAARGALPSIAIDSVSVDGATLKLVFNTFLDEDSVPAKGSFSVSLAGAVQTPTRLSVDGKTLTLTLATAARPGQAVLLTYTKPGTERLRDIVGDELNGFADRMVVNATGGLTTVDAGEDREVRTGAAVTLSGSASSTRTPTPAYSYAWEQTGGVSVTLSGATTATPSFTAPAVRTDLVFSLVVNDGVADSAPDTVTVRVRPGPNPTSAPCVHPAPAGTSLVGGHDLAELAVTDSTISFRPRLADKIYTIWFCRPDGTREKLAEGVGANDRQTVSGLARDTTYWVAVRDAGATPAWYRWLAFTTTGSATAEAGDDREVETGATVTLSGSGSSTRANPSYSYRWTQTGGASVTLSGGNTATPSFTAPSVRDDLVFSLVVNDGAQDSAADTVTVRVRPPPNPSSAPCAHPGTDDPNRLPDIASLVVVTERTDGSIKFRGTAGAAQTNELWFCWPDGTSARRAANVDATHIETVSGLASGTTYWVAAKEAEQAVFRWSPWQAVTTTGRASIVRARFTSAPALGDSYLPGETIRAEVTWSLPVTVDTKGSDANVSVRLDLGADDANYGNSRRSMGYVSGTGTDTLVFEYEVKPGDVDPDGVWLQTESATSFNLVVYANGATIKNGTTDAAIALSGLPPTTGDARHQVSGATSATADAGPDQEVLTGASVTLDGTGSSSRASPTYSYAWTQTDGPTVTLSSATAQQPTFTAPAFRTDLVFSLTVNDGVQDSAADTVTVRVRPGPNPSSAPCAHPKPADASFNGGNVFLASGTTITDSSISFQTAGVSTTASYWFCWPDGTRTTVAENVPANDIQTVSALASGTTYWVALKWGTSWFDWRAFTTTGGASIKRAAVHQRAGLGRRQVHGTSCARPSARR